MALIGKIVTLFADKEKTLPRFPRTKISAVSDDNGVGLDAILDSCASKTYVTEQIESAIGSAIGGSY